MKMHRCGLVLGTLATVLLLTSARQAAAVPLLQLYLEGATYNSSTETWELTPEGSSGGQPFRIWAIGNVAGPGGAGTIYDVKMAIAYDESYGDIQIELTPAGSSDSEYPDWPISTPYDGDDVDFIRTVDDGSAPTLNGGDPLPSHGVYGEGTIWQEFQLGDFALTNAGIANFDQDFDGTWDSVAGQVNVYEVRVTSSEGDSSGAQLHFDLYNHVASRNRGVFAPFSHNAAITPAPATLIGLIGLLPILVWRRVK